MSIELIAEIGINHNGSVDNAIKLIDMAVDCRCNFVKFQKRNPDICTPSNLKNNLRETPWGVITYLDYRKKVEFSEYEFKEIDKYCKKKDIIWFASIWDLDSLDFILKFNLKFIKIPSAMLTNKMLLQEIAKTKLFTYISTGMTDGFGNIDDVFNLFKSYECPFMFMHSVGVYPCSDKDLNLIMIKILQEKYGMNVGYIYTLIYQ